MLPPCPSLIPATIMATPPNPSPTPDLSTTATTDGDTPADPLAEGLQALLNPSIRTTAQKLSNVYLAQQELSGELERLVSRMLTQLSRATYIPTSAAANGNRAAEVPRHN